MKTKTTLPRRVAPALLSGALAVLLLFSNTAASEDDTSVAQKNYDRAMELHLSGDVYQAIDYYKKAIALDPEAADPHADLGEAYRLTGRVREAVAELQTAIKLNPTLVTLVHAYTTLGVIMDHENLPQRAIEYHRAALKIDPENYVAYNNLGHAYDTIGLLRAAVSNYKKSIELREDFAPAYDNLGTDMMQLGQYEDAVGVFKNAVKYAGENHPYLGLYYNDLGAAYVMLTRYPEAREALKKAVELAPDNVDIQRNFEFLDEKINGKSN